MTRKEHEKRVQELVGSTLAEVLYFEIDYHDEAGAPLTKPLWDWNGRFDSLDFGLELRTGEEDAFWISWGHEFFQYDIEVERNTQDDRSRMRMWNVSRESRWQPLLGKKITGVHTYWSWVEQTSGQGRERIQFPQDLAVSFETGATVYLSAFEIWQDGSSNGFADNITVFFDEATAKEYGIGPPASE